MYKGAGARIADFTSFFLKCPKKLKNLISFHFHGISKIGYRKDPSLHSNPPS